MNSTNSGACENDLVTLRERIRPVMRFVKWLRGFLASDRGELYYIERKHEMHVAPYFLDAVPDKRASWLKPLRQIRTKHSAQGSVFKPTEAEVLTQISRQMSKHLLEEVVAYELIGYVNENAQGNTIATLQLYGWKGVKKQQKIGGE